MGGFGSCVFILVFADNTSRHDGHKRPFPTGVPDGRKPINDIVVTAWLRVIGLNTYLLSIERSHW